jgi:hypothetical protein
MYAWCVGSTLALNTFNNNTSLCTWVLSSADNNNVWLGVDKIKLRGFLQNKYQYNNMKKKQGWGGCVHVVPSL